MTFISKYERANGELRKASAGRDGEGLTPEHTRAIASLEDGERDDGPDDEVVADCAPELVKVFRDAYEVPADYPQPVRVSPEDFRRGPAARWPCTGRTTRSSGRRSVQWRRR